MKRIIKGVLYPNKWIGFLFFNLGFGLLIYVFSCHLEETPIAYVSYVLSFYALIIFCIWFYKMCRFGNDFIKASKPYRMYQENFWLATKVSLYSSLSLNLIYGLFELITGVYYKSWWFITLAIYYLLLCVMKTLLVRNINKQLSNDKKEFKKLKVTGIILLFLNLILVGMIILIIQKNQQIIYNGFVIYAVAFYDFYLIISAIANVIKYRKNHSPILIASKCINLTVAMISMISLEVAMVSTFGNEESGFKLIMTGSMGFGICIINSIMSIYMIIKANEKLKEME